MLYIFLLPLIGLIIAFGLAHFFPKAKFRGYDVLPLFFIMACHLISVQQDKPEFLPYGFFTFFILIVILAAVEAIKNKNISLIKLIRQIWDYLTVNTIFWYLGLLFMMI
ncbi:MULTISPECIES: DUF3397 domain-containing protein [unclassified Lactobacillus]|uniref:DUF3397 domain-containing protein n=1 Tax=unclassified Lactobacillus TaxID=2620435 RepID=UPI000EFB24E9|nr:MULTISPECIES: DUF3397 domain-containing protein [unclassified Lactobacillus]RMC25097.1 DUF3397 domain-containing protein [Lactobacillus sp. ESL0247]RMC29252.1 DUF3397 domain-containing protein [Lactobacillus sp. ESL0246]RMC32272.1 DUF3397 domain-containing protein [Lactobacillus sp. ESL0245]RMC48688.1 DUF3397 domain-containing protein [Lactobacillus sp. ESL0228]